MAFANVTYPEIVFVGPTRTGSTWVYNYFERNHNDHISLTKMKEVYYYDINYKKGSSWYMRAFEGGCGKKRVEISPTYFTNKVVIRRMREDNPGAKVVIVYRDPVELVISSYKYNIQNAALNVSFSKYLNEYISLSEFCYADLMSNWICSFKGNVTVLLFSEFIHDKASYTKKLCDVVGVEYVPDTNLNVDKVNSSSCMPKSYLISQALHKIAKKIRHSKLRFLTECANRYGVKNLLYKRQNELFEIPEGQIEELKKYFSDDYAEVDRIIAALEGGSC